MTSNQKIEYWYGKRKEPHLTIGILKEIALNGKQTTSDLSKKLDSSYTTIDTTFSRDEHKKTNSLFRRNGVNETGRITVPYFSLTKKGMEILVYGHYKSSKKPYLNQKELHQFYNIFDDEHEYEGLFDEELYDKGIFITTYLVGNQLILDKLISEYKNDKKIQVLISKLNNIKQKLKELKEIETQKEYDLRKELSMLFFSSFKK